MPAITAERRSVVKDRVELPRVYMGWLTSAIYKPGDADADIAAGVLVRLLAARRLEQSVPRFLPASIPRGPGEHLIEAAVRSDLVQIAPLHYPHLSHTEIFESLETFYKRFYFRRQKIASLVAEMVKSPQMMRRRLREGVEFFQFLRGREIAS